MKKVFNYLIVLVILISFNLIDVNSLSFDCECSGTDTSMPFTFTFHMDSSELNKTPYFKAESNGKAIETKVCSSYSYDGRGAAAGYCTGWDETKEYAFQNHGEIYGDDNNYVYKTEFIKASGNNEAKCPTFVIYTQNSVKGAGNSGYYLEHHFYASDEASKEKIVESANKEHNGTSYIGKCVPKNIKEDVVSNSNEPSNEPTDPNSNIPTVNSNKTLEEDNTIYFCGSDKVDNAVMRNIPSDVPRIIRFLYIFLQVLVPIGIVVVSSIDLFKAISAQKEDDIKKGQQTLIKRIVAAVIIFFVFAIVKLVLSVISDNSDGIIDCISCFLENSSEYCKTK